MSVLSKQLSIPETKALALDKISSLDSTQGRHKLYLTIKENNHYLYDILFSRKDQKELEIPTMDSKNKILEKLTSNIPNKNLTFQCSNIGNLVQYKLFPKSNIPINQGNIFDELPDSILKKEESIKSSENCIEKEKDSDVGTIALFDEYSQKIEDGSNPPILNELNDNIINCDEDEADTQADTQKKKITIDEELISKIHFSDSAIKFSSSSTEEINDILIFNHEELINSGNLENIIELLIRNDYCKDKLCPIFDEKCCYIPLPDWVYSVKSLDPFNLTLTIVLLIIILIISQTTNENNTANIKQKDDKDGIYEQNRAKINQLKEEPEIIEIIFSKKHLDFISNRIIKSYFKSCEYDVKDFFYNQLIELKQYVSKYETLEEKLEKLFEKISFYSLSDILNAYHYTFIIFRNFLINCSSYNYITKIIYIQYKKISNNIDSIKQYKDLCVNEIKEFISYLLSPFIIITYLDYGSSAMGLDLITSDRDILIFFQEKYSYCFSPMYLCQYLFSLLENANIPYLKVDIRYPKSIGQLIEIKYNINDRFKNNPFEKINIQEIKIDITFTKDINYFIYLKEMIDFVNTDLQSIPIIRPLVRIIKSILYNNGLDKVFTGGLNSLSDYFLAKHIVITYANQNPNLGKLLFLFIDKYSKYDFTYGIDEKGREFPFDQSNLEEDQKRFIIVNPIMFKYKKCFTNTDDNIAGGCFDPRRIIDKFKNLLE